MAGVISSLIFLAMLLMIFNRKSHGTHVALISSFSKYTETRNQKTDLCIREDLESCSIMCRGEIRNNLTSEIERVAQGCAAIILKIIKCPLSGDTDTLAKGWLDGLFKITILSIDFCSLSSVQKDIFESEMRVFEKLKKLELKNLQIPRLYDGFFNNLNSLSELCISVSSSTKFDPFYLNEVSTTLAKIRISQLDPDEKDPRIYLGYIGFPSLIDLDLSYNNFGTSIRRDSFRNLTRLQYLTLNRSNIKSLRIDIFHEILNTIKSIDLRNNFIKILISENFDGILERNIFSNINLGGNPFNCTPYFLHNFINQIRFYKNKFDLDEMKCSYPEELEGKRLTEIEFTNEIICSQNLLSKQISGTDSIYLSTFQFDFQFKRISKKAVELRILSKLEQIKDNYNLIWYQVGGNNCENVTNLMSLNCQSHIASEQGGDSILIRNLKSNTMYNFCLMKKGTEKEPIFNNYCRPYFIRALDEIGIKDCFLYLAGLLGASAFVIYVVGVVTGFLISRICSKISRKKRVPENVKQYTVSTELSLATEGQIVRRISSSTANQATVTTNDNNHDSFSTNYEVLSQNINRSSGYVEVIYHDLVPEDYAPPSIPIRN